MKAKLFTVSVLLLFGMLLVWLRLEPESVKPSIGNNKANDSLTVTAIKVIPTTMENNIAVIGITKARWQLDLISPVAGKVRTLPDTIEPGVKATKNTLLGSIVDTPYQSELVMAKSRVAQAELELARFQHEQTVANKVKGKRKPNAYGRFEPHIKYAKADLTAAKARVKYAEQRLDDTQITAPYNAIILNKYITPGQWINEGDVVFKIASTDSIDINIELSEMVWQRLGEIDENTMIDVETPNGKIWHATVRYINPTLNTRTRQRGAVLQVEKPFSDVEPLMPEQQVKLLFKGNSQANVVKAPATVVTRDNKVWSIIANKLALESIEIIEEQSEMVSFRYLESSHTPRLLVLFPLSSMLVGQKVSAESLASREQ